MANFYSQYLHQFLLERQSLINSFLEMKVSKIYEIYNVAYLGCSSDSNLKGGITPNNILKMLCMYPLII